MEFLDNLIDELYPIKNVALTHIKTDASYKFESGVLSISRRPKIGPEAYAGMTIS